jgi:peptidoglycan/xylan/chitin deacetylase (PgdA/CDA1 family)
MPANVRSKVKDQGKDAAAQVPLPQFSFRQKCKRLLAGSLFHSHLLHLIRLLEGAYLLRFPPGSFLPQFRSFEGSKFGILCYHRVGVEGVPYHSRLEPRIFESQMNYLKKHYRLVSLSQMCRELEDGIVVPPTIAITFDDGYRDLYAHAFPILRRLQIPATIYLIGECMQTGMVPWYDRIFSAIHCAPGPSLEVMLDTARTFKIDSHAERSSVAWEIVCYLRCLDDSARSEWCRNFERFRPVRESELQSRILDWTQVREMLEAGISFGAHTWSHPSVSQLSSEALDHELGETKSFLELALGTEIAHFAYPFGKPGDCSPQAEVALSKFRYRSAVTTTEGINSSSSNALKLRRLQIGEDASLPQFSFAVAQMFFESVEDSSAQSGDRVEVRKGMTKSLGGAN